MEQGKALLRRKTATFQLSPLLADCFPLTRLLGHDQGFVRLVLARMSKPPVFLGSCYTSKEDDMCLCPINLMTQKASVFL